MKKNKKTYSTPEVETLVVRFEGCLCVSNPGDGAKGRAGALGVGDEYELD